MKRIAVAQWRQETNSFNPNRTTLADYRRSGLALGAAAVREQYSAVDELGGFYQVLDGAGCDVVGLLRAACWSGGPLEDEACGRLLSLLLERLRAAGHLDGVLLSLHGATAAVSLPDVAAAVVTAVAGQVGPEVPVVVTLDLHANVTPALYQHAALVVPYHCNPHLDLRETGERAAALLLRLLAGEIRPVTAVRKVPALLGAERQSTFDGPLAEVAAAMRAAEADGRALDCGLYPVQPWLDVPGLSSAVSVTTNGDAQLANALADEFADSLWERRDQCGEPRLSPAAVVARVAAAERGPVVIADGADATNSGAPGDSVVLLREFLAARTPGPILISVVDPLAAQACGRAGVGADLTLPVGGKLDPRTGPPLTVQGRVVAISDGRYRISGHGGHNVPVDAGLSVVLEVGEVLLAITSHSIVGSHPKVYQSLGLDPTRARAVVAKSPYGFRHDYGPFAAEIVLADCPGAATGDYRRLVYERVPRPLFPLDEVNRRDTPEMAALAVRPG